MALQEYRRKRNFRKTPEPAAKKVRSASGRRFVVQKHDATRLHFDFRLELDGVLKSWAVPKGPATEPKGKSLAVEVEDHPLEYADFEGTIPQGQYGGGTVMIWDQGTWQPEGDAAQGLRKGKLDFELSGQKLHGRWTLVRMATRDESRNNWLLIKRSDDERSSRPRQRQSAEDRSVVTGRTMDEIAQAADRVWNSNRDEPGEKTRKPRAKTVRTRRSVKNTWPAGELTAARKRALPKTIEPQLATLAADPPAGDDWLHEFKYDGYRILARIDGERIALFTRRGNDWTDHFPAVAAAIARLGIESGFLDGEVVALNERGGTDFQRLQNRLKEGADAALIYYVFDVPFLHGHDLTASPLVERKDLLESILSGYDPENAGLIRYSEHIRGEGGKVLDYACQAGMEGIVSKRAGSTYASRRTSSWLKIKCQQRQEFVIGGYTHPAGSRHGFGSLLVGYYRGSDLIYAGHVGTGFTQRSLAELSRRLQALKIDRPAFANPPRRAPNQRAEWVRPELVAEVTFSEWTGDGILRHPSFQGLREDKSPREIVRESPAAATTAARPKSARSNAMPAHNGSPQVAGVTLSNPDRVLYPEQELTKLDLARYYEAIADWILPHVVDRPLTMVRCPTGRTGQCFYQKHLTEKMPSTLRGVNIKEKTATRKYVVIDDLAGLVTLVQRGVLEIHPWGSRAGDLEHPDLLVMDLDPGEGVPWKAVIEAARRVRDYLAALGLTSFVRTTGGKGLHVVAPLAPAATWEEHKRFAQSIALALVAQWPDKYLATMSKALRRGKVFVDYLRNQRGATAIVSYSTRAREGATVATPLTWDELTARLKPERFTVTTIPKRLSKLTADPWEGFFEVKQRLSDKIMDASRSVLKEPGD